MAAFTVHVPKVAPGETVAPERIVFLRDQFSWGAFFFGPIWLAYRRAWLAALLWAAGLAVVAVAGKGLGLGTSSTVTIDFALAILLGFEGPRIVAWALARKGYSESAVIIGDDVEEAETIFFDQWRPRNSAPESLSDPGAEEGRGEAPSL
jgi:hypothetical protein